MGEISYQNKDVASKVTGEALIGRSLAPFGLAHLKIVGILPTNLPAIESNELRLDNLFLLSDGSVAIIDYESDFDRENFVKYINYIARVIKRYAAAKQLKKLTKLKMVVIYTADVEWSEEIYDLGCFWMKIEAAYLVQMDTNEIYQRLSNKIENGKPLDEEESVELMILPLTVKGKEEKQEMVVKAVELAKKIPDSARAVSVLSGILTFTDKFIDEMYRRRLKEAMAMTKVEQMIYEEGREAGIQEGRKAGIQEGIQEIERLGRLTLLLLSKHRYQELERASKDAEYREKMYQEYDLSGL